MTENNNEAGQGRLHLSDFGMTSVYIDITDPALIKDRIDEVVARYPGEKDPLAHIKLWNWRYNRIQRGKKELYADKMMEFFNILLHNARLATSYFGKKRGLKEITKFLTNKDLVEALDSFENPKLALYNLFYTASVRHIRLCLTDKAYTSVAFGMGTMKQTEGALRVANDMFDIAIYYPTLIGLHETYPELIRAVYNAYIDELPTFRLYINNNIDKALEPYVRQAIWRILGTK
jgi:hypothetical protein